MKNNYALALACAWGLTQALPAQDIDRQSVSIQYIRLPLKKLPPQAETYRAEVKPLETGWGNVLGNEYDADKLQMNGYHRAGEGDADLSIRAGASRALVYDQVQIGTFEGKYKPGKDEPEVAYKAYYYTVLYYNPQIKYRLSTGSKTTLEESVVGGEQKLAVFGSFDYSNAYGSEKDLVAAWKEQKKDFLGKHEKQAYENLFPQVTYALQQYCLMPAVENFKVRYVGEKKRANRYADYREAKDLFVQGVKYAATDRVAKINRLVQPDYGLRKDLIGQAITRWEKALEEADYSSRRARVDAKVARNTYYNLALAYAWMDDFVKAREYLQARREDLGNWDKNFLAGIKELSAFIDGQEARQRANTWRESIAFDADPWVYQTKQEKAKNAMHGNKGNASKKPRSGAPGSIGKNKTTKPGSGKTTTARLPPDRAPK